MGCTSRQTIRVARCILHPHHRFASLVEWKRFASWNHAETAYAGEKKNLRSEPGATDPAVGENASCLMVDAEHAVA